MILHPAYLLILGALPLPWLKQPIRSAWMLLLPIVGMVGLWSIPDGHYALLTLYDVKMELLRVDALSRVFASIFLVATMLAVIYALNLRESVQQVATLTYAGSAIGGVLAGDLLTLFVYWEMTGLTSVFLIWARRSERAYRAGMRYLAVQVLSGLLLLAGLIIHYRGTGSVSFNTLGLDAPGGWLILTAIGIKCAFPVLHSWLQDTYPEATIVGTVVLSSFTTKLGIYALARGYAGTEELIWIGAVMTCFPIFYAVIENDLRRVLAYSLINQLGFMVVGIGIGTEMGVNGAVAHAVADILFKGLLFMSMGAVLLRTGTVNGSELGGLFKSMPQTATFCMVGAASISAFPLFSGFVTKSMIMTAVAEEHRTVIWLMLLFASAGVFHHAGIKIPFFAFFAHDRGYRVEEAPLNMRIAMGSAAALCILIGCAPELLYGLLPYPVEYVPYTTAHVINQTQLLLLSAMAFTVLMRTGIYPPELRSVNLDFDWFYRRLLPATAGTATRIIDGARNGVLAPLQRGAATALRIAQTPLRAQGWLALPWTTSLMIAWTVLLLGALLLLALLRA
ncbi:MAG: Na(+)/H(+) antiporter subunit D [Nevskiales bacterium]|nr:Na(+)/H(+) antiporter subunit D [Nevskiales bacterium]